MANSVLSALPLLCFALLCLHPPPAADAHGLSYIQKLCSRATRHNPAINPDFCITSLQTVPESYATNVDGLLKIATDLAVANATATARLTTKLISVTCDDLTRKDLQTCLAAYGGAATILNDAEKLGSAAEAAASACEKVQLLKEETDNLRKLAAIADAFNFFVNKHKQH